MAKAKKKKSKRAAKAARMIKVRSRAVRLESPRQKAVERDDISYTPKVGWLLAHNSVRATVDTRGGVNGFRRFWVPPSGKWQLCSCAAAAGGRTSGRTTPS